MIALSCALAVLLLVFGLRYGRAGFARLAGLQLRASVFALGAFATQALAIITEQRIAWLLVSLVCLTIFCLLNRRYTGMALVYVGIILNLVVMLANDGVMPVNAGAYAVVQGVEADEAAVYGPAKSAVIDDSEATLAWLGDRLLLPGPLARLAAWSIGDVIMIIGIGGLLGTTMRGRHYATTDSRRRMARL